MAGGRRRPARASGGGRSLTWLWVGALLLVGAGVLFARETRLGRELIGPQATEPEVRSRSSTTPVAAPAPTAPARPTTVGTAPVTRVEPKPTSVPAATRAPTAAAARITPTSATARRAATVVQPGPSATPPSATARPTAAIAPVAAASATPGAIAAAAATAATTGLVALTFDAGADRGYAQDILDMLAAAHVVASFGVTGQWARANPDLVRRMAAEGHQVFNHTLDHRSFTGVSDSLGGLSAARRRAELEDAEAILDPLLGHTTRPYYRLPYGDDDAHVAADVQPAGYTRKIGWTVDSLGWRGAPSAEIVARCLKLATPGAVYVFHVGRASQDALALPRVIEGLQAKGFGFQRIDQS